MKYAETLFNYKLEVISRRDRLLQISAELHGVKDLHHADHLLREGDELNNQLIEDAGMLLAMIAIEKAMK